jgi:GMP synthase (glutamine-hydrolysing)
MSEDARLKTRIRVQAMIRSCQTEGIPAFVTRKGDEDAGIILIKQNLLDNGFIVLAPMRQPDGRLGWFRGTGEDPVSEQQADGYIARQVDRDSDIWVIEIEDRDGRLPLADLVL